MITYKIFLEDKGVKHSIAFSEQGGVYYLSAYEATAEPFLDLSDAIAAYLSICNRHSKHGPIDTCKHLLITKEVQCELVG